MRSRLVLLAVAVAVAAVVAAPFALGGDDATPPPAPHSAAPSTPPSSSPTADDDMVPLDEQQADVDGDGRPDEVRLLRGPEPQGEKQAEGAVEVTLADGATGKAPVPLGYFSKLLPALDINRDGHEQVMFDFTAGGDGAPLLVYGWYDGGLVSLESDPHIGLGSSMVDGLPGSGYYVEDGGLFSWGRTAPFDPERPIGEVDVWSWTVEGDRLVATPEERRCMNLMVEDQPHLCR
jgi:hypothetical protein